MNSPKLRFPGFSGGWQPKKLGDIARFLKGRGISKDDINKNGKNEAIRYGELYTKYSETISNIHSKTDLNLSSLVLSKINDVIIPASGETSIDIATASCVLKDGVALGGDINIIRTEDNGIFLSYYLNNSKKYDIAKISQGNSVVHLYASGLKTVQLMIPSIIEQQKIADFLTVVDEKITTIDKKVDLLNKYKKSVMQKIFTQQIRFKDENGNKYADWKEDKLGKISDVRDGTHESPTYVASGYPLITSKNLLKNGKLDLNSVNYISEIDYNNINKRSGVDVGDILFGMIGTIGNPVRVRSNSFSIKNVALIKGNVELKNEFLIQYLNSSLIAKQFYTDNSGGTQKFLSLGVIRNLHILIPHKYEQQKIADFLTSLDDEINLIEKELDQAKQFKKALLQRMFV